MMWWFQDGGGWWLWLVMPLGMVAFWGLVIWGVVAVARAIGSGASTGHAAAGPEQILAERFARSEIDADEYQRRLTTLRSARDRNAA